MQYNTVYFAVLTKNCALNAKLIYTVPNIVNDVALPASRCTAIRPTQHNTNATTMQEPNLNPAKERERFVELLRG